MPLRLKLLIAVIVLVFAGLGVADVVTYTQLRSSLLQRVDQQLGAAVFPVAHSIGEGQPPPANPGGIGNSALPPGTFGEVLDPSGGRIGDPVRYSYEGPQLPDPALPSTLPSIGSGPDDYATFTAGAVGGSSLRYRVRVQNVVVQSFGQPLGVNARLVIAIPLTEADKTLSQLRAIEVLVTLAILLGLGFLSWWIVRRGLRPLDEIGDTAGAIAAGDLSRRVPYEDSRTEIGRLGVALNAMLAQIERAFAERKASEDRLRRFLADASHELRTPLTSIRGYAELFRRGASENEHDLAKSMRRIEDESARMGVMVEDLLLLARLDQDRPLELGEIDLAELAADAVQDARASGSDRPIALEAPAPVPMLGDEARLRQVAANLVANAIQHTPPGTPVTVRASANGAGAVLEVADRGPGLSEQEVGRAFEPFYIVAAIAKAHGGSVEVGRTPGGGATFRVLLPQASGSGSTSEGPGSS